MKKILIIALFLLSSSSFAAFMQGSLSVDLKSTGPELVFSVKVYPGGGNVVDGWTTIDWFVTYSSSYTMTFGSPVVNATNFPGVSFTFYGQNAGGSPGTGLVSQYWSFAGAATTTKTYVDGTEYEMFRVPISTSSVDFGDLSLSWNNINYTTYFSLTGSIGTDWTAAGAGANAPIFYGPGTYSGDNGNNFNPGISGVCSYTIYDKPLIPMVLYQDDTWAGGSGVNPAGQPGGSDGSKKCYIRDSNAPMSQANAVVGALIIQPTYSMIIQPNASLTATGATTISSSYGLQLYATSGNVTGSFIDNGTITYGTGATAYVETYLTNTGGYYYHLVGPTVDNLPSGSGVPLGDFDLSTNNTYAYEWNEATQLWVNQYSATYPVNTGNGLLLTTNNGTAGAVALTGTLINTNVSLNLSLSGDPDNVSYSYGWNLKSNPFSAALDWDDVWTREYTASSDLNPTVYVWSHGSSNYAQYNAQTDVGTGMTKDIQIGQGFWAQYDQDPYTGSGSVNITLQASADRNHSTAAFLKDAAVDQLTLTASGNNSADVIAIAFRENATFTYDRFMDVDKWESFIEEATEIWTVSNDQKYLTHNILPPLGNSNVSVPMSFECHAAGEYTITASDIESFQGNVEIYLEDLTTGGEWHDLVMNPVYTFEAAEPGASGRFIVHFFGTTGIDDPESLEPVSIYAWGQDAYIVNRSKETIKEYVAYDMMGRELHRGSLPNSTVNKVTISDVSAYYIVKVITKEGRIYTDKVYIQK
jgi:hypothetical protein